MGPRYGDIHQYNLLLSRAFSDLSANDQKVTLCLLLHLAKGTFRREGKVEMHSGTCNVLLWKVKGKLEHEGRF